MISKMMLILLNYFCMVSLLNATPYKELNQLNLNIYAKARALDFMNVSYIMIIGDSTYLYQNGKLIDSRISMTTNTTYEILKEISHLSLGIVSNYGERCDKSLSNEQVVDFRVLLNKIYGSIEPIDTSPLIPNDLKGDQLTFINESMKVVEKLLYKLKFDCADMQNYVRNVRPILDKNLYAASLSQLKDINQLIRFWIDKYREINWKSIYILQCGNHMPREKNILAQYFQKLMGIKFEGEQFVYAETGDETACKSLLATHITDRLLGLNIFDEPLRLHRDLLADAAEKIVPTLVTKSLTNSADRENIKLSLLILILEYKFLFEYL